MVNRADNFTDTEKRGVRIFNLFEDQNSGAEAQVTGVMMVKLSQAGVNVDDIGAFVRREMTQGLAGGNKSGIGVFPAGKKSFHQPNRKDSVLVGIQVGDDGFHFNNSTISSTLTSLGFGSLLFFNSILSPVLADTTILHGIPIKSASANFSPAETLSRSSHNISIPASSNCLTISSALGPWPFALAPFQSIN